MRTVVNFSKIFCMGGALGMGLLLAGIPPHAASAQDMPAQNTAAAALSTSGQAQESNAAGESTPSSNADEKLKAL